MSTRIPLFVLSDAAHSGLSTQDIKAKLRKELEFPVTKRFATGIEGTINFLHMMMIEESLCRRNAKWQTPLDFNGL